MRSNKKYSNATFTKRVDHVAGRHHIPGALSEPAICKNCGASYAKRRWTTAPVGNVIMAERPVRMTICPACKCKAEGVPNGFLDVTGAFAKKHTEEIERLLRNEAARAAEKNPLARIIDFKKTKHGLKLTTTTEHLAQRLGHALEKAYSGEVEYDFSHENKVARVNWCRE